MKVIIVGGDFGIPKPSGIIRKIDEKFSSIETGKVLVSTQLYNGGTLDELPKNIDGDLILWMPNISNETEKQYPKKNIGSVLICSKVMREGYHLRDAVSRIFKMHGNAVIAIYKTDNIVNFKLIDALGNIWFDGSDINSLYDKIMDFYWFTKSAIRLQTKKIFIDDIKLNDDLASFIEINKLLSEHIQTSCGERFFGNLSTRCQKLFPTAKVNNPYDDTCAIFVSPRNVDKEHITPEDMVLVLEPDGDGKVRYVGDKKPSVDSPIQLMLYVENEKINYMIHGHAFIENAWVKETSEYCLCGDLNEAFNVSPIMKGTNLGAINLKNHGFLIYSDTLDNLKKLIKTLKFSYKRDNIN